MTNIIFVYWLLFKKQLLRRDQLRNRWKEWLLLQQMPCGKRIFHHSREESSQTKREASIFPNITNPPFFIIPHIAKNNQFSSDSAASLTSSCSSWQKSRKLRSVKYCKMLLSHEHRPIFHPILIGLHILGRTFWGDRHVCRKFCSFDKEFGY